MNRRKFIVGAGGMAALAGAGLLGWRGATGSLDDYQAYAAALRAPLPPDPVVAELIRFATLAPNGHNTQPWRFAVSGQVVRLMPDLERRTPVVDPDDHHLYVSLGCAAETLAIAGRANGRPGAIDPAPGDGAALAFSFSAGAPAADPLFDAIPRRQSTRGLFDGRPVPTADLAALAAAGTMPGVRLVLLTEKARIAKARDLIVAANDRQMTDTAFMDELRRWIRFNPKAAMRSGDGLFSAASGNPSVPDVIGDALFSMIVTAKGEGERYARQLETTPLLAAFFAEQANPAHWMTIGRACQRFALTATTLGLKLAFVNQAVEVAAFRPALAELAGESGLRPDLLLRIGYGAALPYSPRRPVAAVMSAG